MKKILSLATAFVFTLAVKAQTPVSDKPTPKADDVIKMNVETHDFGKVPVGTPVTYEFEIKNISDKPLVIESATASCGCTVPEVPKEPIKPGAESEIKVVFNSEGKMGVVDKQVTVTSNGVPNVIALHLTGEIKERQ